MPCDDDDDVDTVRTVVVRHERREGHKSNLSLPSYDKPSDDRRMALISPL